MKHQTPAPLVAILKAIEEQTAKLSKAAAQLDVTRHFTLDGRLVGDIGEMLAAQFLDLTLDETQRRGHDGFTNIESRRREVQIKCRKASSLIGFSSVPDLLVIIAFSDDWSNGSNDDARANQKRDLNSIERAILATPALKASMVGDVTKVKVAPMFDASLKTKQTITHGATLEPSPSNPQSANELNFASSPLIDIMASFTIGEPDSSFTLSNIEMLVHKSQIISVVGPVASGKSVLVQGLVGELLPAVESNIQQHHNNQQLQPYSGKCIVSGKIAYASQVPFILNATIRDKILFGDPYNEDRYNVSLRLVV
jgi:ABC-type multidrug transport system fused ATPase/permease subunit